LIKLFLFFASIVIVLLFRKRLSFKRIMTAFFAIIIFFAFLNISNYYQNNNFIFVRDDKSNFTKYGKISKYEKAKNNFYSLNPLLLTDESSKDSSIIISEQTRSFSYPELRDIGIDTLLFSNKNLIITIRSYSSEFIPCTLYVFLDNSISHFELDSDTELVLDSNLADSIYLSVKDDNPDNEFFSFKNNIKIQILSNSYSPSLQKLSSSLSALFENVDFSSGITRKGITISSEKSIEGVIYVESDKIVSDSPFAVFNESEINSQNYISAKNLIKSLDLKKERVKNPFNPSNKIQENLTFKFIYSLKNNLLLIFLIFLFILLVIYLF